MAGRLLAIEREIREMWNVAHVEGDGDEAELLHRLNQAMKQIGHAHLAVIARPRPNLSTIRKENEMAIPLTYDAPRVKASMRDRIVNSLALPRSKQEQYARREFWHGFVLGVYDYTNFLTLKDFQELRDLVTTA